MVPEVSHHPLLPWRVSKRSVNTNTATQLQGGPTGTLHHTTCHRVENKCLSSLLEEKTKAPKVRKAVLVIGRDALEGGRMTHKTIWAERSRAEPPQSGTAKC